MVLLGKVALGIAGTAVGGSGLDLQRRDDRSERSGKAAGGASRLRARAGDACSHYDAFHPQPQTGPRGPRSSTVDAHHPRGARAIARGRGRNLGGSPRAWAACARRRSVVARWWLTSRTTMKPCTSQLRCAPSKAPSNKLPPRVPTRMISSRRIPLLAGAARPLARARQNWDFHLGGTQ